MSLDGFQVNLKPKGALPLLLRRDVFIYGLLSGSGECAQCEKCRVTLQTYRGVASPLWLVRSRCSLFVAGSQ